MKKKLLLSLLVTIFLLQTSLVSAQLRPKNIREKSPEAIGSELKWDDTYSVMVMISKGNSSVDIGLYINANENASIIGRLYLEQYSKGVWQGVTSWGVYGRGSLAVSKVCNVSSGKYRARISARIGQDYVNETSETCYVN